MQLHIGTKLIKSLPMNRLKYNMYRGWDLPEDEDGADEGFLVEYIDGGKENHPDHKGYISWSPEDVFHDAYQDVTKGVSFGSAVMLARRGYKVARKGWNGADMFAYIIPQRTEENSGIDCLDIPYKTYREHWALFTAQKDIAMWSPSGSDSLANDWVLVE